MNRALKEEELTLKVALYVSKHGSVSADDVQDWIEEHPDYIRCSEPLTITFKPLPDEIVLAARVAMLDAQITEVRAKLTMKVNDLEDQKQRLLAITHD